jgi:hypothetical protein
MATHGVSVDVFVLLLADHVELKKDVNSLMFLKVTRRRTGVSLSKAFSAKTAFKLADANRHVYFNSEFCIKSQLEKTPGATGFSKKIVDVKLSRVNPQKRAKEDICLWKWDVANLQQPGDFEIRTSAIGSAFGEVTIFFRLVVVPSSQFHGMEPHNFFGFIAGPTVPAETTDGISMSVSRRGDQSECTEALTRIVTPPPSVFSEPLPAPEPEVAPEPAPEEAKRRRRHRPKEGEEASSETGKVKGSAEGERR